MHPLPNEIIDFPEQPTEYIETICNLYFRSILLKYAGTIIPQHVHHHDHATYVGSGAVRLWINGEWKADYLAGRAIEIKAGHYHVFLSLEDNTRLTCVHDLNSAALINEVITH